MFFFKKEKSNKNSSTRSKSFAYLSDDTLYFDSACQTLRPQEVIDEANSYFKDFNACGGRVKYRWGKIVDTKVLEAREQTLSYLNKSHKEYLCSFTLNTSYGINLILQQVPKGKYSSVITSEIEHNSVFLPTIITAERLGVPRKVLPRAENGELIYDKSDLKDALVVLNISSNIDGRILENAKVLAKDIHNSGGALIIDAAQGMISAKEILRELDFDALCFSAHKMYSLSLGGIIAKKDFVENLKLSFVGGGMVEKIEENSFVIPKGEPECRLEPGLADFAGIVALNKTFLWLKDYKPGGMEIQEYQKKLSEKLFEGLKRFDTIKLVNQKTSSVISFYFENIDSHKLAAFLSEQNIMLRSGYFCCHYYLQNLKALPPLLRVSLALHNTEKDVERFLEILEKIINNIKR